MAYDLELAKRIKAKMAGLPALEEKKMFGGVGFLLNGNVACGVNKNDMIVRVDPEKYHDVEVNVPFARPFALSGKPMKGWLLIAPEGLRTEADLDRWIKEGVDFARSLPKKKK
jgi:TfoX/Sxy family transcriptional regulator of competence genes